MKVRIVRQEMARGWHYALEKYAGKVVKVKDTIVENGHIRCYVTEGEDLNIYIPVADAEVVEPRLYEHEGKQYALPDWATHVAKDRNGLTAWNGKPMFNHEYTYFHITKGATQWEAMKEYVRPLPEGVFCVEVE